MKRKALLLMMALVIALLAEHATATPPGKGLDKPLSPGRGSGKGRPEDPSKSKLDDNSFAICVASCITKGCNILKVCILKKDMCKKQCNGQASAAFFTASTATEKGCISSCMTTKCNSIQKDVSATGGEEFQGCANSCTSVCVKGH